MLTLYRTDEYDEWLRCLKDQSGRARILMRTRRATETGNLGDHKAVGGGVLEMRIDVGPGYRVYFARQGDAIYLLLTGGDKSTQDKDIARAIAMWDEIQRA